MNFIEKTISSKLYNKDTEYLKIGESGNIQEDVRYAYKILDMARAERELTNKVLIRMHYHLCVFICFDKMSKGWCGYRIFDYFSNRLNFYRENDIFDSTRNLGMNDPETIALNMILTSLAQDFVENQG